jgi:hypothetical protein
VGYLTSEWGDNSVGKEMAAVLQSHDKGRLEARCYGLAARLTPSHDSLMWRHKVQPHCAGGLQVQTTLNKKNKKKCHFESCRVESVECYLL